MNNGFLFRRVGYTPTFLAERYGVSFRGASYWYNNEKNPKDSVVINDALQQWNDNMQRAISYPLDTYQVDINDSQDVAFAIVLASVKPQVRIT